jgi:hypothetical protein
MRTNVLASATFLALIMLVIYLTVALCITRPKPLPLTVNCKVGNVCKIEGKTFLMLSEVGK